MPSLNKANAKGLSPRHILIVFTAALLCFVCSGMVFSTWSIFVVPVSNELDVTSSQFTITTSLIYLSCAILSPPLGNLMEKYDLRIILGISACLCGIGFLVASQASSIWQIYIAGILEGSGVCAITYLSAPTLINRWFNSHMGLLVGICVAMMGIGGATWSMIGGVLIANFNWHIAYIVFGLCVLILSVPAILLFVRSYPKDVELKAFGNLKQSNETESAQKSLGNKQEQIIDQSECSSTLAKTSNKELVWGVSAKNAFRHPAFYTLAITIALFNGTAMAANLIPTYVYYLGDLGLAALTPALAIMAASLVATCTQVTQAIAKVVLGAIADKTYLVALCLACGLGALGVVFAWQGYLINSNLLYVGSALFGFIYGATNVLGPTITRKLFGSREYTKIYSRVAMIINITPVISTPVFAALSEQSWNLEFGVALCCVAVIFLFAMLTVFFGRSIKQTLEEKKEE